MREQDSLENLLNKVADLLQDIESKEMALTGEPLAPEAVQAFDRLKLVMRVLNDATTQFLKEQGKTRAELQTIPHKIPEHFDKRSRQLIERSQRLKESIYGLKQKLTKQLNAQFPPAKKSKENEVGMKRKKKMSKQIGHKGWKKL